MACRENLKYLRHQCTDLKTTIEGLEEEGESGRGGERGGDGSVASCGLMRAQMRRLGLEIEREEGVERSLVEKLKVRHSFQWLHTNEAFGTSSSIQECPYR